MTARRAADKIVRVATKVDSFGHFCLSPLCLHVAGKTKCTRDCCKIKKTSKKGKKR